MTPVQAMLDRAARISAYKGAIAFDTRQQADEYRAYTQLSRWIETGRVERVPGDERHVIDTPKQ